VIISAEGRSWATPEWKIGFILARIGSKDAVDFEHPDNPIITSETFGVEKKSVANPFWLNDIAQYEAKAFYLYLNTAFEAGVGFNKVRLLRFDAK